MRVAIHQPHYLPWLGYIDKIDQVDRFVLLDHVQFDRRGWQNRNYVKAPSGKLMLTAPVVQKSVNERIIDKRVDNGHNWTFKHRRTIEQYYRSAPFWSSFEAGVLAPYESEHEWLVDLAIASTSAVLTGFGVETPIVRSSELAEFDNAKTQLIADVCQAVGATTYVSGEGARDYLDVTYLERRGISVEWQNFNAPVYQQLYPKAGFVPGVAAIDLLMNAGSDGLRLLRSAQGREPDGDGLVQPTTSGAGSTPRR